jgi:hypothetical protein
MVYVAHGLFWRRLGCPYLGWTGQKRGGTSFGLAMRYTVHWQGCAVHGSFSWTGLNIG